MADPLTPEQFAQRIRTKHPGAYDDIPDAELTQKVLAKYPEYRDMVTSGAPPQPAQPGFIRSAASAVGVPTSVEELGNALSSAPGLVAAYRYAKGVYGTAKEGLQQAKEAGQNVRQGGPLVPNIVKGVVLPTAQMAGAVAPLGTGNAVQMGQQVAQGNYAGAGGTAAGTLVNAALMNAGAGQGSGASTAKLRAAVRGTADKFFVPGTPEQLMVKAIRPPVTRPELETAMSDRMGQIMQRGDQMGRPVNNLDNYTAAAQGARYDTAQAYQDVLRPNASARINTSPVRVAMMNSIPPTDAALNPSIVPKTAAIANKFPGRMAIGDADAIRVDTNAKLDNFYAKAQGDRGAALSQPNTAMIKSVNDKVRQLVYDELRSRTGVNPEPIQNAYGQLDEITNAATKRGVVYGRQVPVGLGEQIVAADKGVKAFITAKLLRSYNNPDTIVRIAYERWAKANGITPSWRTAQQSQGLRPAILGLQGSAQGNDSQQ